MIAGTLDTVVGFGGLLLLLPILVLAVGSKDGVVLAAIIPLGWNLPRVVLLRERINWRTVMLFSLGIIPGTILGTVYLDVADPAMLRTVIGIVLIAFGVYYVLRLYIDIPGPRGVKPWVFPVAGFLSGALAGAMGAGNGPLQSGALAAASMPARDIVATNGAVGAITAIVRLVGYGAQGMLHEGILLGGVVGFIGASIGAFLGIRLASRAKNSTLELIIGIAIVLAGIKMMFF